MAYAPTPIETVAPWRSAVPPFEFLAHVVRRAGLGAVAATEDLCEVYSGLMKEQGSVVSGFYSLLLCLAPPPLPSSCLAKRQMDGEGGRAYRKYIYMPRLMLRAKIHGPNK